MDPTLRCTYSVKCVCQIGVRALRSKKSGAILNDTVGFRRTAGVGLQRKLDYQNLTSSFRTRLQFPDLTH
ncbi:hypothetical protein WN51_11561 [Melipona quadrifasciata]|uniref:Uncharacterized protein n=1 Tax=Melipona quadrifasciata TaxID=166423 RepID=A0A0N0U6A1_9HYME|nr:hypothetical protein WN51_11561 [Melipona quadrifasciata]